MKTVGSLTIRSTSAHRFNASGEAARFERWLRAVRHDMTRDACRQVVSHARTLIDLLGNAAPASIAGPPEQIRARLDGLDLRRHGLARDRYRYLLRAGAALHAATHDLDTATTRGLMDRRTPQQHRPIRQRRRPDPAPGGDLLDRAEPRPSRHDARTGAPVTVPVDPQTLPAAVRPVVESVNHSLTAQLALDDAIDVAGATRAMMRCLSPAARVRVAAALPETAQLPVTQATTSAAPTLAQLAEEAVVSVVTERYADLRPQ